MPTRYTGDRYKAKAAADLVTFVESGGLYALDYEQTLQFYIEASQVSTDADYAYLGCVDRYFLLTHILGRHDAFHPWLFDRCREVEHEPDGRLDLWSREHYKSTLITFSGVLQEILNDPEITIGIFSHTKAISSKFLAQIKREFEQNEDLRLLYPDLCWIKPQSEAPEWSTYAFTVRRKANPKEATVEAHGLVDGQPTSRHFILRVYDDVVTRESVTTPEQVTKTTEAFELSDNLGAKEGRFWMIGTRYSFGDSYGTFIDRGIVVPRVYAATENGRLDGTPVLLSPEQWEQKKKTQRSTVAAQMMQNPLSGKERVFLPQWFRPWFVRPASVNVYIMADPSRGRTATSDRTAIAVLAMDSRGNKYLVDGYCHRMTLSQRWDHLKHLHKKWSVMPGVGIVKVGYERFGQQSDDEYFTERMRSERYSFSLHELSWPREGGASKQHRVERLQPDFEFGSFFLPGLVWANGKDSLWTPDEDAGQMKTRPLEGDLDVVARIKVRGQGYLAAKPLTRKNEEGEVYDLTLMLMDEMLYFPFGSHDDLVDAASRIYDIEPLPAVIDNEIPELPAAADA